MDDAVFIGGPEKRDIVIEDYDPAWTARFEQIDAALRQALGDKARRIEHFGSTAVPGLGAKGIVDVLIFPSIEQRARSVPRPNAPLPWEFRLPRVH